MESLFLFIVALIEAGIIFFQNRTIIKITEEALDKMAQRNAGIYYPKDVDKHKLADEVDRNDVIPLEDLSDEDFLKAVRKDAGDKQ